MCLPSRCLAVDVSSDFTAPSFGRHVTIVKTFASCFGGLGFEFRPRNGYREGGLRYLLVCSYSEVRFLSHPLQFIIYNDRAFYSDNLII
jgi:hypothetical protein